ncbi:MAG: phosphatidylserine decarboxylase family protein [Chloroflexi bacterium]|nr:phosphatidylserine decarboxylase family protein [Chloroflexota bacterium]
MRLPRFAPELWRPLAVLGSITALALATRPRLALVPLALAGATAFFFRDPDRVVDAPTGVALAPADGWVTHVRQVRDEYFEQSMLEIVVFLSMLDVHVQRSPLAATVLEVRHTPGPKRNALFGSSTDDNERTALYLDADGTPCTVVQIAGMIARAIVTRVGPGDRLAAGERIGMIKFGSRTSLRLPLGWEPLVDVGDHVTGGRTRIAARRDDRPGESGEPLVVDKAGSRG